MNKVLLFGGTGEGRALAEWMAARGIPHTVCVATEYGETLLPAGAEAHVGRMDSGEMEALMRAGGYSLAVDATHPYAVEVTEHIRAAAEAAGLPVLRLVRQSDGGELPQGKGHGRGGGHAGADARPCAAHHRQQGAAPLCPARTGRAVLTPGAAHGGLPGAVPDPGLSPEKHHLHAGAVLQGAERGPAAAVSHSDPGDQGHRGVWRLPGKGGGRPGGRAPCWWWSAPAGRPA